MMLRLYHAGFQVIPRRTSATAGKTPTSARASISPRTRPSHKNILYDTQGILTSGLLRREHALRLLLLGPEYDQTVLKTEKAAAHLRFLSADELSAAELSAFREAVAREERTYQEVFAGTLSKLLEED